MLGCKYDASFVIDSLADCLLALSAQLLALVGWLLALCRGKARGWLVAGLLLLLDAASLQDILSSNKLQSATAYSNTDKQRNKEKKGFRKKKGFVKKKKEGVNFEFHSKQPRGDEERSVKVKQTSTNKASSPQPTAHSQQPHSAQTAANQREIS